MKSTQVEFQTMLTQISDRLGLDDVKRLTFLLHPYSELKKTVLEKVDNGLELFKAMEDADLLSISKVDVLINILDKSNLKPLVEKVKQFVETHASKDLEGDGKFEEEPSFGHVCNIQPEMIVEHFKETSTLNTLRKKLEETDFVTLCGLLGSGKSQIALRYGCIFRQKHEKGVCWRLSCPDEETFLNSLKRLVDKLGLKKESKQDESKSIEQSIDDINDLILKTLYSYPQLQHLLIFDDVTDDTKIIVDKIIEMFLKKRMSMKIIVTSWIAFYADDRELVQVKGFTEEEAVEFLCPKSNPSEEDKENYRALASELSSLPLALYGARTYMKLFHISPRRFIRKLKDVKSISEIEKLVAPTKDNKKLFTVMLQFLEILKKEKEGVVFDKILCFQFLETDDIPVLLFDFLPSQPDGSHESFSTDKFIQAFQEFSFGVFRGEDDERYISTHSAVIKAISRYTTLEVKVRIMKNLLKAFMWLMDKDNIEERDYLRNQTLLPHAISTLNHAQKLLKEKPDLYNDLEFQLSLIYVNDVVGYTYNFFGILYNAGQYSTSARTLCFTLLRETEKNIHARIEETLIRTDDYRNWKKFAEKEALVIDEYLTKRIQDEESQNLLNDFAYNFILNKYRSVTQIVVLQEFLEHPLEREYVLTTDEYEELLNKELAIPKNELGSLFVWELIMQVFYTYGRRLFYLSESVEKKIVQDFAFSLFLAREIGQIASVKFPNWKILYTLLTEISGTLEQQSDDRAGLSQKTIENFERAVKRYEEILEEDSKYYIFGVIKVHSQTSSGLHTKKLCYKRILHCYSRMGLNDLEDSKKNEIHTKGEIYTKKLEELSDLGSSRQAGYDLWTAEFKMSKGDYDSAEEWLKKVVPKDIWIESEPVGKSTMKGKELLASKRLVTCLVESNKISEAKRIFMRLKSRLEDSNEEKELSTCIEMAERLQLGLERCS